MNCTRTDREVGKRGTQAVDGQLCWLEGRKKPLLERKSREWYLGHFCADDEETEVRETRQKPIVTPGENPEVHTTEQAILWSTPRISSRSSPENSSWPFTHTCLAFLPTPVRPGGNKQLCPCAWTLCEELSSHPVSEFWVRESRKKLLRFAKACHVTFSWTVRYWVRAGS